MDPTDLTAIMDAICKLFHIHSLSIGDDGIHWIPDPHGGGGNW